MRVQGDTVQVSKACRQSVSCQLLQTTVIIYRQTAGMYKKTDDNTTLLTIYILVLFEREAYTSSRKTTAQRQQWLPSIWGSLNSEQEAIQT